MTEAMTMFREAQESDQQGDAEGAERQFRDALAAFEHLLPPTHENTKTAAYSLAAFYARRGRMPGGWDARDSPSPSRERQARPVA